MRRAFAVLAAALLPLAAAGSGGAEERREAAFRALVFTKTAGFRHESIPAAVAAVRGLGARHGFEVDATEDAGVFADAALARYDVVVFLLTTGDVLDERQQEALGRYVRAGGGFAGVHSAADTEHGWHWYGGLVGARFRSHPAIQPAAIRVADRNHASTGGLPARWRRTDEWYNFAAPPGGRVHVLATLDETSYEPGEGAMGARHPIAWARRYDGGRSWYTGGGHTPESYSEPLFLRHLLGGIRWAAGVARPRVLATAASVDGRRVAVTARVADCSPCAGTVRLRAAGRLLTIPLRRSAAGRLTAARTGVPSGRWTYSVLLRDPATGLTAASPWRAVRVP